MLKNAARPSSDDPGASGLLVLFDSISLSRPRDVPADVMLFGRVLAVVKTDNSRRLANLRSDVVR